MCIDTGWTSVMYDGSHLPFEENLHNTRIVSEMAHSRNVSVEGEVGAIGGVEDDLVVKDDDACLADPEQAVTLAKECNLDVIAAACGTAHGMYKAEPRIRYHILEHIKNHCNTPQALHGGTGLSRETFAKAIALNCKKSTSAPELKITGIDADFHYITQHRTEYDPLKLFNNRLKAYREMVAGFLEMFGSVGKA